MSVTKHTSNNLVTVSYPVRAAVLDITHAEHTLILAFSTQKVQMIKFIRAQYSLGLYEAKQVVDTVIAAAAESEAKERLNNTNSYSTKELDWGTLPRNGVILVRDCESYDWEKRVFITYDEGKFYKYVCKEKDGTILTWKYAKLITD